MQVEHKHLLICVIKSLLALVIAAYDFVHNYHFLCGLFMTLCGWYLFDVIIWAKRIHIQKKRQQEEKHVTD